jgi:hypothetical protein
MASSITERQKLLPNISRENSWLLQAPRTTRPVEQARRDGFVVPQESSDSDHFTLKGYVDLSSEVRRHLIPVAYDFFLWTSKDLIITSGTRTAERQA